MAGGRPQEYDKADMAKKLLEWAILDSSINLNEFCSINLVPPSYITRWANDSKEFCEAYEITKAFLSQRRERKLKDGELHVKAYDLNAAVYDYFLKQEKRDQLEFESKLKAQEVATTTEDQNQRHNAIIDQIKALQDRKKSSE